MWFLCGSLIIVLGSVDVESTVTPAALVGVLLDHLLALRLARVRLVGATVRLVTDVDAAIVEECHPLWLLRRLLTRGDGGVGGNHGLLLLGPRLLDLRLRGSGSGSSGDSSSGSGSSGDSSSGRCRRDSGSSGRCRRGSDRSSDRCRARIIGEAIGILLEEVLAANDAGLRKHRLVKSPVVVLGHGLGVRIELVVLLGTYLTELLAGKRLLRALLLRKDDVGRTRVALASAWDGILNIDLAAHTERLVGLRNAELVRRVGVLGDDGWCGRGHRTVDGSEQRVLLDLLDYDRRLHCRSLLLGRLLLGDHRSRLDNRLRGNLRDIGRERRTTLVGDRSGIKVSGHRRDNHLQGGGQLGGKKGHLESWKE